jgi:hypothetical protein
MSLVSGDRQRGAAGRFLAQELAVRVRNRSGASARGIRLRLEVIQGGGALAPAEDQTPSTYDGPVIAVTDSLGVARIRWRLGAGTTGSGDQLVRVALLDGAAGSTPETTFRASADKATQSRSRAPLSRKRGPS